MSDQNKKERLIFILKIRKSNTNNSLWENKEGKAFLKNAKSMVKNSKVIEDKEFFTLYEVVD